MSMQDMSCLDESVGPLEKLLHEIEPHRHTPTVSATETILDRIVQAVPFTQTYQDICIIVDHIVSFESFTNDDVFDDSLSVCMTHIVTNSQSMSLQTSSQDADHVHDDVFALVYVCMVVLIRLGVDAPNVYRRLVDQDWIPILISTMVHTNDLRVLQATTVLFYKLCQVHEMSMDELRLLDTAFINRLFDLIEATHDTDGVITVSLIHLMLTLHHQIHQKHHATMHTNAQKHVMIDVLGRLRMGSSRTLTETLAAMYNRSDGGGGAVFTRTLARYGDSTSRDQHHDTNTSQLDSTASDTIMHQMVPNDTQFHHRITRFLVDVFQDPVTRHVFYTNDLTVIVDVVIRDITRLDTPDDSIQKDMLKLMIMVVGVSCGSDLVSVDDMGTTPSTVNVSPVSVTSSTTVSTPVSCASTHTPYTSHIDTDTKTRDMNRMIHVLTQLESNRMVKPSIQRLATQYLKKIHDNGHGVISPASTVSSMP